MLKTLTYSDLNIKTTHFSDINKLSTQMTIVAIAFLWPYLANNDKHENICTMKKWLTFFYIWTHKNCTYHL
ncbi:hypothetical protein DDZ16_03225 [Marinilabilia rubra]|uniref:Uncharacterized protein n=1 Tax=Marinilabilia rubra TaxID=2162893 RepID=A0A2U2BC68_9BACT|nr:hypothetical protein DDZ16_03225 [Marinilabilia rubra]